MIDPVITFDRESVTEILYCFDKSIDDDGYVIDSDNKRVLALDGKEIQKGDISGIINVNGEPKFIRNSLISSIELIEFVDRR